MCIRDRSRAARSCAPLPCHPPGGPARLGLAACARGLEQGARGDLLNCRGCTGEGVGAARAKPAMSSRAPCMR
eukprot:10662272-Alexandrium_andersonii.AAC.1